VRTVSSKVQLPTENKEAAPVDLDWVADLAPPPPPQSRKERRRAGRRVRELTEQIEETEAWLVQLDFDAAAEQSAEQATRIHAEKENGDGGIGTLKSGIRRTNGGFVVRRLVNASVYSEQIYAQN
jgi:hypothetical protein